MYFKRLEMFGFKSFADKTVLEFQPGISTVVGPNGCGKSNVFDAIRWVLGEQSAKDMRGEGMMDVIFSGTDKRSPLGFAEVSVTFSNESRMLPIDFDEVVVSRRLFRSGESEYLLNKSNCRLKDIIELFLGTGIGSESYSLIQQGKVDLVVSAKPDDRRQIFDEAAGITKYKAKKKEALSKLKETEDNLLRINDIVVEVKRQIATIERQAKKAQKYKEEFEQLKSFELIMAQYHLSKFNGELAGFSEEAARLQEREAQLGAQLQEFNNRLEHETVLIEELEEEIKVLREKHMRVENDIDINTRQIAFNEERLENIDATQSQLESDKSAALERCKAHQIKIEEIKAAIVLFNETLTAAKTRLQQKKDELSILVHSIEEATTSIKTYEQEQFALNAQEVRIKNQLTELLKRRMELLARRSRLEHENNKVASEKTQITQKNEAIMSAIANVNTETQAAWAELSAQRQILETAHMQLAEQENTIDELEKTKLFLASQKEFVAKMQDQYQDSPDPVVEGKFISVARPSDKQTGIIGKIKSIIEIPATETTPVMYEVVYETKFVELDLAHTDERITTIDGQLAQALDQRDVISNQLQAQQQTVDTILKNIQELEKKLSVLDSQKTDIEFETGKIVGEIDLITSEFSQVASDLASVEVQEAEASNTLSGIGGQIKRCQEDVRVKQSAIAGKHKEREEFNVTIAQLETELQAAAEKQRSLEENCAVYTQSLDRDLADVSRFDQQFGELNAKKASISEDISRITTLIEQLRASSKEVGVQLEAQTAQKSEMTLRLSSLRQQSRAIEDEVIAIKTERHNQDMRQQEIMFNQRSLKERMLQTYRIDMDNLNPIVVPAPETLAITAEGEQVATEALESQQALEQASVEAAIEQPQPVVEVINAVPEIPAEVNYEELAIEIEKLKKRCEAYGAVNLVAIEEFEELKTRFEFLTKQQSDLLTAREALMSTIQKINRTTRQMFTDTFTKVNEEFKVFFKMLFGGGEAELILLDPENALECGIDIVARPPGKKPQHISLLSGGEKTLTAIALIFGVFKVNPSPFCVLDEIDAALDESNVGRFNQLLKSMAKIAQFIVITHNKKTMESSDVMYGVTQPERGISRIVSVKFNNNGHETPQQTAVPKEEVPQTASA
jgi:chromosome segregation protein